MMMMMMMVTMMVTMMVVTMLIMILMTVPEATEGQREIAPTRSRVALMP
jgi:hypothetical protein